LVRTTKRVSALALFVAVFTAASEVFFVCLLADNPALLRPALSLWSLLVANLVGVAVMLAYFFGRNPGLGGSLLGSRLEMLSEGIVAGLIGGLVVALWFFLIDVSVGRPFQTPSMLGAAIVGSKAAARMALISPEMIFIYTVLHFAAFMLFGVLVAALLASLKRTEVLVAGLFLVFLLFELFFVGLITMIDEELLSVLRPWKIELGNLLASGALLAFLLARNHEIRATLVHGWKNLQNVMDNLIPKLPGAR
jgi:glycopeptide antibiotics resistance protein